jgi:hypothetical protein
MLLASRYISKRRVAIIFCVAFCLLAFVGIILSHRPKLTWPASETSPAKANLRVRVTVTNDGVPAAGFEIVGMQIVCTPHDGDDLPEWRVPGWLSWCGRVPLNLPVTLDNAGEATLWLTVSPSPQRGNLGGSRYPSPDFAVALRNGRSELPDAYGTSTITANDDLTLQLSLPEDHAVFP